MAGCVAALLIRTRQRATWIRIAREFPGTDVWVLVFDTPYAVCAQRLRERKSLPFLYTQRRASEPVQARTTRRSRPPKMPSRSLPASIPITKPPPRTKATRAFSASLRPSSSLCTRAKTCSVSWPACGMRRLHPNCRHPLQVGLTGDAGGTEAGVRVVGADTGVERAVTFKVRLAEAHICSMTGPETARTSVQTKGRTSQVRRTVRVADRRSLGRGDVVGVRVVGPGIRAYEPH